MTFHENLNWNRKWFHMKSKHTEYFELYTSKQEKLLPNKNTSAVELLDRNFKLYYLYQHYSF